MSEKEDSKLQPPPFNPDPRLTTWLEKAEKPPKRESNPSSLGWPLDKEMWTQTDKFVLKALIFLIVLVLIYCFAIAAITPPQG